ncbi:MAG: DUF6588 family protein [Balneolaceae bacterium]
MKRLHRCGTAAILLTALTLIFTPRTHAQLGDAGEILRGGAADANLLLENYLKPFGSGFGADLNSGWVNTARPYRTLGFDFRATVALSVVPEADLLFDVGQLTFTELEYLGPAGQTITPTIAGEDVTGVRMGKTYTDPMTNTEQELFAFDMPPGVDFPYVPAPMAQLTVGAIRGTDVTVRFMPSIEIEDVGSISLWGLGVKHGLNQWIPGGGALPVDISVQLGYTSLAASSGFDVQPEIDSQTHVPSGYETNAPRWDGQGVDLNTTGFTGNVLVGKNLPILSIFGGIGFQNSNMKISTPGHYPLVVPNTDSQGNFNDPSQPKRVSSIEDPIDLELKGDNSIHALAGFRLRFGFLAISGSYTMAKYPTANLGVGISLR